MALFQIAEPGESAAPHEHKLAIGIDLGTTNSLVATVRSGISICLSDDQGRPLLPARHGTHQHEDCPPNQMTFRIGTVVLNTL